MTDESIQKLQSLRESVLTDLEPLMEKATLEPELRFNLFLATARTTGNPDSFEKARAATKDIADEESRTAAYLDLLDAIDEVLDWKSYPAQEQVEPEAEQHDQDHHEVQQEEWHEDNNEHHDQH